MGSAARRLTLGLQALPWRGWRIGIFGVAAQRVRLAVALRRGACVSAPPRLRAPRSVYNRRPKVEHSR